MNYHLELVKISAHGESGNVFVNLLVDGRETSTVLSIESTEKLILELQKAVEQAKVITDQSKESIREIKQHYNMVEGVYSE